MIHDKDRQDSLSAKADAAFEQVAQKVIQRAKQTGTPVVVWKEGRIEEIPCRQVEPPSSVRQPTDH